MKKIILMMLMVIGFAITSTAQVQTYKATSYAFATVNQYTGKYVWGDWYKCQVAIVFDMQRDIITIYSKSTQYYTIISEGVSYTDNSGGKQVSFKVIDQDDDKGTLRLRVERNGNSQIYIDFADCAWVYNVTRTS